MPIRLPAAFAAAVFAVLGSAGQGGSPPRATDDLYGHVNHAWLAGTPLPPDRVDYHVFAELGETVEARIHAIIGDLARQPRPQGSPAQQMVDLHASVLDAEAVNRRGLDPIREQLDRIEAIRTTRDVAAEAGRLTASAAGGPFAGTMVTDPLDRAALLVRYEQGGTLLPGRDAYLSDGAAWATMRARYVDYLTTIFGLLGRAEAPQEARDVLALETALARVQWTLDDTRDPARGNQRVTLRELARAMPGFAWDAWAAPQGIQPSGAVILGQPSFFAAFAALVPETPVDTWRAWLRARYLTAMAPNLADPLSDARLEFFGRFLTGQEAPRPRWRRGVALASGYLPDAVGRLYVERHVPRAVTQSAADLAARVRTAFRDAVAQAPWLSAPARRDALYKLSRLRIHVGAPSAWRDTRGLEVRADDLFGNVQRARAFEHRQQLARAAGRNDPRHWPVAAQSVAAVYSPATNEVFVPAGMLQPPIFDPDGDAAANYGALGAIVGHELSHALDARGRHVDGDLVTRDWWTPADEQAFLGFAARLVEQAGAFDPGIDGVRTFIENAADLAGLAVAFRAYRQSLEGRPSSIVDGTTGEQRFFMAWARTWRTMVRPEYVRQRMLADPHAPGPFRVNAIVQHLDAFQDAFGVKPGDRLYRAPGARLRVW